ncbi:MAG TPA: hypothetical protein VL486_09735 [Verrucomicrobiae bacterium]|nr:hypothetical protein [Verrucomicrobiae bacterium]
MNDESRQSEVAMMRFTLREDSGTDFLERAAAEIRQLPSVLRVRTDAARQEIEIVFKQPVDGLLRQVNDVLKSVSAEMTTTRMR